MGRVVPRLPWPVVSRLIDTWIWSERNRSILKDKLYNDPTFEALAEKNNLSVQQTKTIVKESKAQLYSHIPSKYFS